MATLKEVSYEYTEMMENRGFEKGYANFMLCIFVTGKKFLNRLDDIINKVDYQAQYFGMWFSDGMSEDSDFYFGENKILFFVETVDNDEDNDHDILDYEEFYKYLEATCEFYIKYHPDEKDKVMEKLQQIKKVYLMK